MDVPAEEFSDANQGPGSDIKSISIIIPDEVDESDQEENISEGGLSDKGNINDDNINDDNIDDDNIVDDNIDDHNIDDDNIDNEERDFSPNEDLLLKIKKDIKRNSGEVNELKINDPPCSEVSSASTSPRYPTTPLSSNAGCNSIPAQDKIDKVDKINKINKRRTFPRYVYADIFDEDFNDDNPLWSDLKRYRFQKCLWKLKYNRIISQFYLDSLRRKEQTWSWMIIVISTLTSGLTVANNVDGDDVPIDGFNTYINVFLTISSMSTSLIAAWIKKQMFIEKINEIDKYLININALCEELDIQLSLLNTDRTSYIDFKKKYIPEITKFFTTNPIIPPEEWKNCIREITTKFPELLNIDNSEDNKMWPWYGDLIYDTDDNEVEYHTRYPTSFMKTFKRTNRDKLRSSCCGGGKYKNNKYSY